jgi:tRNA pseudouridine38-40 synthase
VAKALHEYSVVNKTLCLHVAYDGTAYSGWQTQPGRPTVQAAVEAALGKVTGQPVAIVGSSRTDAGVHALGQVVSFESETRLGPEVLQRALNAELPDDVQVFAAAEAPGFHAIRHAVRKRYRYLIDDTPLGDLFAQRYAWRRTRRLDDQAMHRAAQALVGTHDFRSFENLGAPRASSVRTIYELTVRRVGCVQRSADAPSLEPPVEQGRAGGLTVPGPLPAGALVLEIEGNGFLYNMVRNLVGTLALVGRGAQPEAWPAEVLAACDRTLAGPTAPPQGLFLLWVAHRALDENEPRRRGDAEGNEGIVNRRDAETPRGEK